MTTNQRLIRTNETNLVDASKTGLKVLYTNADQFVNKRDDLLMFMAGDLPDVILITEVIPKSQVNPITQALLDIKEYNCLTNFDPEESNLGGSGIRGVAIYTKKSLRISEVKLDVEGCHDHAWVEIGTSQGKSVLCGCVYRSPSQDSTIDGCTKSTNAIINLIKTAHFKNNNLIIAGDFNYKEIDWCNEYAEHQYLTDFIDVLQECFLYQHVTEPTRHRLNETSNLLDLVLSSEEDMVYDLSYHSPLGESDHVILEFHVNFKQNEVRKPPERNIYKADYEAINKDVNDQNWEDVFNSSFENDYNTFLDTLQNSLEKHSPLKANNTKKKNIYMTSDAMRLKNKKRRLWKRYLYTKSNYDRQNFINSKNILRATTRKLRREYERNLAKMVKSKPKDFWRYAKSRLTSMPTIPTLMKTDGSKASTPTQKAEVLIDYFSSVFTREDIINIPSMQTSPVEELLSTIVITPDIVKKKLENLNSNKSPGHDAWHPHFLKNLSDSISEPLSMLFNKSLKEGAHSSWTKAIITAIFKKGLKSDRGNYRPISLTSVISKVMESIVKDAIIAHLMKHGILSDEQHGFVPGRDCITQLLICMEDWTNMAEQGKSFDIIYTDFSKAFDSVAHERLLLKLEHLGITGDLLKWIRTFLTRRTQCVRVDGVESYWRNVLSGIPQGSVLGPLLFVIFINDMPDEVKLNICKLFADDCKLYGPVCENDGNKLQTDLRKLEEWSEKWQLPFNVGKCKVMHFGSNNPHHTYDLNNVTLHESEQEKDLGVVIDNNLKFRVHAAAAIKRANRALGMIQKAYTSRDKDTIPTLYKAMVRPHLEYGNAIWGPFYQGDKDSLESVQRRATKLIDGFQDKSYSERLRLLELPSLGYRRKRGDMIWMFKIMNGIVRIDASNLFERAKRPSPRFHAQTVFKRHATKSARSNSFSQRCINDWNNLPNFVIESPNLNTFKNRLDIHWKSLHYEYDGRVN